FPQYLAAVADGMGGHAGGDVASRLAIEILKEFLTRSPEKAGPGTDYRTVLKVCFEDINRRVFSRAAQDDHLSGMGSTMVAALVGERKALVANVGDCRAYLYRDRSLSRITRDHNWKEEQLRAGKLAEEQILNSPLRHLVTRSLGFEAEVEADTFDLEMRDGDYLLLCSDGLYKSLDERTLVRFFKRKKAPDRICRRLIRKACRKGGQDNITAVVLRVRGRNKNDKEKTTLSDTVKVADPGKRKED
ncbi:MAG: protein phosphatase 2C domain-containing protein, partial [Candidatus Aminicenantales bacterium]